MRDSGLICRTKNSRIKKKNHTEPQRFTECGRDGKISHEGTKKNREDVEILDIFEVFLCESLCLCGSV
jgi:hypothetical protein